MPEMGSQASHFCMLSVQLYLLGLLLLPGPGGGGDDDHVPPLLGGVLLGQLLGGGGDPLPFLPGVPGLSLPFLLCFPQMCTN